MEYIVQNTPRVHDKGCIGCEKFKKDVMLTIMKEDQKHTEFLDFFLTQKQAESLYEELGKVIGWNKEIMNKEIMNKEKLKAKKKKK